MLKYITKIRRPYKVGVQVIFDISCSLVSVFLAFSVRLDSFTNPWPGQAALTLIIAPITVVLLFWGLGLYRGAVRYISETAFRRIATGVMLSVVIIYLCNYMFYLGIPRSIPILHAAFVFLFSSSSRILVRGIFSSERERARIPAAVYGTPDETLKMLAGLSRSNNFRSCAVFWNDDKVDAKEISGIPLYSLSSAQRVINTAKIECIFCTNSKSNIKILQKFTEQSIVIKVIDDVDAVSDGTKKLSSVRGLEIADILGREEVPADSELLAQRISGKVIMITGAGGSIGREICKVAFDLSPAKIVLVDNSEFALYKIEQRLVGLTDKFGTYPEIVPVLASVLDRETMLHTVRHNGVQSIFHAAAYKHVPLVEANPFVAIENNVFGTYITADIAARAGVESFTLISTDKAVRPTNIMGASKRLAEISVQYIAEKNKDISFGVVRFGNVLGSSGSVIPKFKEQIDAGGPVTVTHPEITRYFMTVSEAAKLVLQAASLSSTGEVFLLDMGASVKIIDLARNMVSLSGYIPYLEGQAVPAENGLEIRFTGLRPGEKLYEELLVDSQARHTSHPLIFCDGHISEITENIPKIIDNLRSLCEKNDIKELKYYLKDLNIGYSEFR